MRKFIYISAHILVILVIAGCSYYNKITSVLSPAPAPGLKARLTVADFEARAAGADSAVASELRQMLIDSLVSSKRVIILERNDADADLIVIAEVAEFAPQASGGRSGIGGGGGASSSSFGGLLGTSSAKANMTLNIKIADSRSSQVLAANDIRGQVKEVVTSNKVQPGSGLKGNLSEYANTPMGTAINDCINASSRYIYEAIPQKYFKY
jgi:curli biogenesis system outer membrane secretion channel CsgG